MTLLTPDQYADLLLERQTAWIAGEHPSGLRTPWVRPLLDWFIQNGDEHLVDMDQIHQANRAEEAKPGVPASVSADLIRARLRSNQCKLTAAEKRLAAVMSYEWSSDNASVNVPMAKRGRRSIDSQLEEYRQATRIISALRHKIGLDVARLGRLGVES